MCIRTYIHTHIHTYIPIITHTLLRQSIPELSRNVTALLNINVAFEGNSLGNYQPFIEDGTRGSLSGRYMHAYKYRHIHTLFMNNVIYKGDVNIAKYLVKSRGAALGQRYIQALEMYSYIHIFIHIYAHTCMYSYIRVSHA